MRSKRYGRSKSYGRRSGRRGRRTTRISRYGSSRGGVRL